MNKILIGCFFCCTVIVSAAQSLADRSIQDSVLGWMKVYHFKGVKEGRKMDDRFFSAAQISIADSFANWIQASYLPKAGIGDVRKTIFPKANMYRLYEAALPQGYGATAYTWNVSWDNGKLKPIQETESPWSVLANSVPAEWAIMSICDNTHFYFTMPELKNYSDAAYQKEQDLSNVQNLKPYTYHWIRNVEAGGGTENVFLCRGNKLPFIKITKGEYLDAIEKGIGKAYEEEKKKIYRDNQGNQKSIDYFMKYLEEKNSKRITCLKNNKEKYKNHLQEPATVFSDQPDIMLENYPDVFEGNGGGSIKIPVYKLDPSIFELCKKDQPQWIRINWMWNSGDPKTRQIHESIINNFNFDFVYNFFFAPEKIRGKQYEPLHAPYTKEKVEITEASATAKNAAADKNIIFFEDFSSNAAGQKPVGWFNQLSNSGYTGIITTIENEKGKWLAIKGNTLIPKTLKTPLPQNFSLSYDVLVPKGFTWGGKGLEVILTKEKTALAVAYFIRFRIKPGADGREGAAELETNFANGYTNETKWYELPGFSNDKTMNRISITIKKNGEDIQVFIDKSLLATKIKALPSTMLLNTLSFSHGRSDSETEKYFITNIKITKE